MTVKDLLKSRLRFNSGVKHIEFYVDDSYTFDLSFNYNCGASMLDKYGKYDMIVYNGISRILTKTHLERDL